MGAESASDDVLASWSRAHEELLRTQAHVVLGEWEALARQSLVLGRAALDLGITASKLPTVTMRAVDDVVTALLRASDLAMACARLGPDDPRAAADAAQAFHVEAAHAVESWRLIVPEAEPPE